MEQERDDKNPLVGPWNGEISTESLAELSPVELADALENALNAMSEEDYDPDLITAYLDALEKKRPLATAPDARAAEADFRRKLGASQGAESAAPAQPKKGRRYRVLVTVAATMALLLALMVGAQAAGFDIFGALARWTEETFRFTSSAQETQVSPYYEPLRQTLKENGILGTLAPKWYPEGFVAMEPEVKTSKRETTVIAIFKDEGGKEFAVSITLNSDPARQGEVTYEKDDALVEMYTSGERTFYIFANLEDATLAVWSDGGLEESIRGELSVEEVKQIIDSIGE